MPLIEVPEAEARDKTREWSARFKTGREAAISAGVPKTMFRDDPDVMSEISLAPFWKHRLFTVDDLAIITGSFGRTNDPEWGRALTVMAVHTLIEGRGRGRARRAYEELARFAIAEGMNRIVTTSGSIAGFNLHWSLGYTPWTVNGKGQIVFESSIDGRDRRGVPPRAAKLGATRPMTLDEARAVLTDPSGPYRAAPQLLPSEVRNAG